MTVKCGDCFLNIQQPQKSVEIAYLRLKLLRVPERNPCLFLYVLQFKITPLYEINKVLISYLNRNSIIFNKRKYYKIYKNCVQTKDIYTREYIL